MRKLSLSLLVAAVGIAAVGTAFAQTSASPASELTRAAAEQRAAQAFQRMDANGDGKIDQADREARHKARFDQLDADSNGAISLAEFTAARGDRAKAGHQAQRGERMGRRDAHSGRRMDLGGHGGFMAKAADTDGDGTITQAEFQAAALERFDRADANSDGVVTREEQKAARAAMHQRHRGLAS